MMWIRIRTIVLATVACNYAPSRAARRSATRRQGILPPVAPSRITPPLVCALTAAHPKFARDGARAFAGPVKFYTSHDGHMAWLKAAHQAGVGRAALRLSIPMAAAAWIRKH